MFHKISDTVDYLHMSIKPNELQTIIAWSQGYGEIVSLDDLGNFNGDKCNFCITFDDGYKNNLHFVDYCPNVSATIYLATSYIGTGKSFWADKIQTSILMTDKSYLDLTQFKLGSYQLATKKNKKHTILKLNILLKKLHPKMIDEIILKIFEQLDLEKENDEIFLNWKDVKFLKNHGIEFGSHTHNHVITTRVSRQELEKELDLSSKTIEQHIHCKTQHFAYPNGTKNDICEYYTEILSQNNYKTAVTTIEGSNKKCKDPFMLKRINVTNNRISNPFGQISKAMFTTLLSNPLKIH